MQFEYTNPQTDYEKMVGGHYDINAFGKINPGDDVRFQNFLTASSPPVRASVYIDSSGGDVEAAINIGRAMRDNWFSTSIGKCLLSPKGGSEFIISREWLPGSCCSAATLIFIGGRLRYFPDGSKFGVHQFSFKNPLPKHKPPSPEDVGRAQILSAKIARYIADMGISPEFLELSSSAKGDEIRYIEKERLKSLKVVTDGMTDVTWSVQAFGDDLYIRGERDSLHGHHKVLLRYSKDLGFVFHAVIEAQGREYELTHFGSVEITLNGREYNIDISNRCERTVHGIYVNVIAKITQEEARLIAHSTGFGVQIRFTNEAPLFLGISPMSTESGSEQLATFYKVLCDGT